ncbi:hypothetical protein VIH_003088 [Vibrio cholerae CT 5369-93]|nr:hypothetical protein VIH_003088 [Vibrio cholerae CT 5369-93]
MEDLEQFGIQNDLAQSDKSKKYLNITRDTENPQASMFQGCWMFHTASLVSQKAASSL